MSVIHDLTRINECIKIFFQFQMSPYTAHSHFMQHLNTISSNNMYTYIFSYERKMKWYYAQLRMNVIYILVQQKCSIKNEA